MKKIRKVWENFKKELAAYPLFYFLLGFILLGGFFLRVFRVSDLLGFYYDQGRDALVLWRLWHEGRLFLIGPVTGIEGIFLGPFYYYLIAPFYLIGGGNPVVPAIFLAILSTAAVPVIYLVGWKLHSKEAGILASLIFAFSYYLILASRWLASPTVLILVSVLLIWSLYKITKGEGRMWLVATLLVGIALQLEAASAFFYLPTVLIFAIWQGKNLPSLKVGLFSLVLFLATLLPQILFDFRHDGILRAAFQKFLLEEQSFRLSFWEVVRLRLPFYLSVFENNILPGFRVFFLATVVAVFYAVFNSGEIKKVGVQLLLLVILIPLVGLLFFQGNFGNVWGYYLTGIFVPAVLLFGVGLGQLWKTTHTRLVVAGFLVLFLFVNGNLLYNYFFVEQAKPDHMGFREQKQAVDWVYEDAAGTPFNLDVYVPPVIPYAYDYLFLWWGTLRQAQGKLDCHKNQCGLVQDRHVDLLYTLYEVDPPHPERLTAWLERQKGIGMIEEEVQFGGITVQRRERINQTMKQ